MNQAEQDYCVLLAQNGRSRGFYLLFKKYHRPLLGFALKICNQQDIATDACQETWIKIAKNIRQLKDPRAFKTWLYTSLKWKLVDLVRAEHKHAFDGEIDLTQIPQKQTVDHNQTNITLKQALKSLASIEKQIIHLFYFEEMSIKEIAKVLKLTNGTVKSRLFRARTQLKQKYLTLEKQL